MKKFLLAAFVVAAVTPAILPSQFVSRENCAQAAPGKVLLRLRLKPGQHYVMRIGTDNTVSMNMKGGNRPMRQNMTMTLDTRVLAVAPSGTMTTRMTFTGMKMVMDMGGRKTTIDAAHPRAGDPSSAMFRSFLGVPLTSQITPAGKTLSVKGMDVMVRRMMAAMPMGKGAPSAAQKRQVEAMMTKMINPEKLQMMGQNFYPPRAVGVGESWRAVGGMMGSAMPAMNTTYRLVKRSGGVSTVSASGTFGAAPKGDMKFGGSSMRQKMTGRLNLLMQVDEKTGLARLATGMVSVNSQVTIGGAKPQKITTQTQSRIRATTSDR